jgi:hypothetical protein
MSRGVEAPWVPWDPGVPRALGFISRPRWRDMDYGVPGAAKNTGDDAWLFEILDE